MSTNKNTCMFAENEGTVKSVEPEDDGTSVETCSWLM